MTVVYDNSNGGIIVRKNEIRFAFRPTEKLRVYFEKLGFIDGRSGNIRKDGPNFSEFINHCIIYLLETDQTRFGALLSGEELELAYLDFKRKLMAKEWENKGKEFQAIKELISSKEHILARKKVLKEVV